MGFVVPLYVLIPAIALCVMTAALVAGLTLGLMSLDTVGLEILMNCGTEKEKKHAAIIRPIRKNGNLLLVTLLLANTGATELLPILMEMLPGGGRVVAVVGSIVLILFAGEIVPQAVCARHGLAIGAFTAPILRVLWVLLFPISFPIAWCLDKVLGRELGTVYTRSELKGLLDIHSREKYGVLSAEETVIMKAALDFTQQRVLDIMTPRSVIFALSLEGLLDEVTVDAVVAAGHSRVPIVNPANNHVMGVVLVKNLLAVRNKCVLIRDIANNVKLVRHAVLVPSITPLNHMLCVFQNTGLHMAFVYVQTTQTQTTPSPTPTLSSPTSPSTATAAPSSSVTTTIPATASPVLPTQQPEIEDSNTSNIKQTNNSNNMNINVKGNNGHGNNNNNSNSNSNSNIGKMTREGYGYGSISESWDPARSRAPPPPSSSTHTRWGKSISVKNLIFIDCFCSLV